MAKVIDSSIFIEIERRDLKIRDLYALMPETEEIAIAAISVAEILAGIERADTAERRMQKEDFLQAVLDRIPLLPFDLDVARIYARLWMALRAKKVAIPSHDLQIGATALAYKYGVLTTDIRHFHLIPGLEVKLARFS